MRFDAAVPNGQPDGPIDPCKINTDSDYVYVGWALVPVLDYAILGSASGGDPNAAGFASLPYSGTKKDSAVIYTAIGQNLIDPGFATAYTNLTNPRSVQNGLGWGANMIDSPLGADGDFDYTPTTTNVKTTVYRLREGVERFFITDINNPAATAKAQSSIAVLFDEVETSVEQFNHIPGGGNILYMDGHVEFKRFPGESPCSRLWAVLVGGL